MANPFLVLGGVAVGVITAGIGVLSVPGWIDSAHDSAAMNDIANVRLAETAASLELGKYTGDLGILRSGDLGVAAQPSDGVTVVGIHADDDSWCFTVKSKSGAYLAGASASSKIGKTGKSGNAQGAMHDAGCSAEAIDAIGGGSNTPDPTGAYASWSLLCDAEATLALPVGGARGTATWSDGLVQTINGDAPVRAVPAGEPLTVRFDGTFTELSSYNIADLDEALWGGGDPTPFFCFRSMDEWVGATGTTDMSSAFAGQIHLTDVPAAIPSTVTNLDLAFMAAMTFNGDLSGWDTRNVTSMERTFNGATSFNGDISGWNTSKVTNMAGMFAEAQSFNQSIGRWDTSQVTRLDETFVAAASFNQPLNDWDISKVTTLQHTFAYAESFNQPLDRWDTSAVEVMSSTFRGATAFGQDLSGWSVASVTQYSMFSDGSAMALEQMPELLRPIVW